jgi:hypothetical protein
VEYFYLKAAKCSLLEAVDGCPYRKPKMADEPTANRLCVPKTQIRTYWWCSPPISAWETMRHGELLTKRSILRLKWIFDLKTAANTLRATKINAIIVANVKRFSQRFNADEVFGTHREMYGMSTNTNFGANGLTAQYLCNAKVAFA